MVLVLNIFCLIRAPFLFLMLHYDAYAVSLSATVKEKHEVYYGCCVPLLSLYLWFDSDHCITVFALLVNSLRSTYPHWPGYIAHPSRPGIQVDLKSFSSPFSPDCNVWHQKPGYSHFFSLSWDEGILCTYTTAVPLPLTF